MHDARPGIAMAAGHALAMLPFKLKYPADGIGSTKRAAGGCSVGTKPSHVAPMGQGRHSCPTAP